MSRQLWDHEPRVPLALAEWLKKAYPARCIGSTQTPELAHRYAGAQELAARLIRMAERVQEPGDDI